MEMEKDNYEKGKCKRHLLLIGQSLGSLQGGLPYTCVHTTPDTVCQKDPFSFSTDPQTKDLKGKSTRLTQQK